MKKRENNRKTQHSWKDGYTLKQVILDLKRIDTISEVLCYAITNPRTFSYLGFGCSRTVFQFKHYPYVLKIMRETPYHDHANQSEVNNTKEYGTFRLPKVFAFNKKRYNWIISEYIPFKVQDKNFERDPDYKNLFNWAVKRNFWDLHHDNVRRRTKDGKFILIDAVVSIK